MKRPKVVSLAKRPNNYMEKCAKATKDSLESEEAYSHSFDRTVEMARKTLKGFAEEEDFLLTETDYVKDMCWRDPTRAGMNDAWDYINYILESLIGRYAN